MPGFRVTNFNIILSLAGGWITLFGLVSFLCKEKLYLSEALISLLAGVAFSPAGINLIRPEEYADDESGVGPVTLSFTRLVLGVQLVIAGVQLPRKYILQEWRPLGILVILDMALMWLTTSTVLWLLVSDFPYLHALAVGSCVTPTDPILSNVIVHGRFADQNIPKDLQNVIVAESGVNDGFGYPFLFIALYLIEYTGSNRVSEDGGLLKALGLWLLDTWFYVILLSVLYGIAAGWTARNLLHWASKRGFINRESFTVYAVTLSLLILGTCGMAGSDDILACFIAGNVLTWDDYFRVETIEDSFQPTIDMLLNVSIFMWFGAVCPWHDFAHSELISIYELIAIGVLILLLRRLPWVIATSIFIPQISSFKESLFVGFFGPIGVSAIFYLYVLVEYVDKWLTDDGKAREDISHLKELALIVVWFLTICSIVVHGLAIPVGKFVYNLLVPPRSVSQDDTVDHIESSDHHCPVSHPRAATKEDSGALSQLLTNAWNWATKRYSEPRHRTSYHRIPSLEYSIEVEHDDHNSA